MFVLGSTGAVPGPARPSAKAPSSRGGASRAPGALRSPAACGQGPKVPPNYNQHYFTNEEAVKRVRLNDWISCRRLVYTLGGGDRPKALLCSCSSAQPPGPATGHAPDARVRGGSLSVSRWAGLGRAWRGALNEAAEAGEAGRMAERACDAKGN